MDKPGHMHPIRKQSPKQARRIDVGEFKEHSHHSPSCQHVHAWCSGAPLSYPNSRMDINCSRNDLQVGAKAGHGTHLRR